jgi:hypothetical protein
LVVGVVLVVGADDAAASTAPGEVRVCDRSFVCTAVPMSFTCSPTPLPEIWAVENLSAYAVEFYDGDCAIAQFVSEPGSSVLGPFEAAAYRMTEP